MSISDEVKRWTWDAAEHPEISIVFSSASRSRWSDALENAARDAVTGKVLCVVAGLAIARAVIEKEYSGHELSAECVVLLDLANAWIDDPSDEKFEQITQFLFDDKREWCESRNPLKVAWGALRIASSSVGNYEAGWALSVVVSDATEAIIDALEIAQKAVESRKT